MKKLIATDPRASRFTNDPVDKPGDVFMPKDKRSSKILKALKWARDLDVEKAPEHKAEPGPAAVSSEDVRVEPVPVAIEPEDDEAADAEDESGMGAEDDDIESVRAEYERVTGEPADKRYGAARLREEMAKHAGRGRYQRRDMQAEDE